ncbi:MAG: hypothetical protein U0228_26805 [Myxococcaceae bacterium]
MRESSRLNAARRACARHRIAQWLELRETDGVEAVQQELDAMARTWRRDELEQLVTEALGPESAALRPLVMEAALKATREAGTKQTDRRDDAALKKLAVEAPKGPVVELKAPDTLCDAPTGCAQLRCVAAENGDVNPPARACIDEAAKLEPGPRAAVLSEVLHLLPPGVSGPRTEATLQLEALRQEAWVGIMKESAANHVGRAAQLATPFLAVPRAAEQIEGLRNQAQAHHLSRARALAKWPDAAWLHRKLSESFGGPVLDTLPPAGKWEPLRWRCPRDPIELPPLPAGLTALFSARCESSRASQNANATQAGGELRTFDLERELLDKKVSGSLTVTCAGKESRFAVNAPERETLVLELQHALESAVSACAELHRFAAVRSCADVNRLDAGTLTARFVDHARYTRKWEPCFVEWLAAVEGVGPPELPAPVGAHLSTSGLLDPAQP